MEKQQELQPTKHAVELKRLSDTRWACQYSTIRAIKITLPAILATLVDVNNQTNAHRGTESRSVIGLTDAQFVLHICWRAYTVSQRTYLIIWRPQIWSWHLPLIWSLQLLMPSMTNAMLKHGLKSGSVPVICVRQLALTCSAHRWGEKSSPATCRSLWWTAKQDQKSHWKLQKTKSKPMLFTSNQLINQWTGEAFFFWKLPRSKRSSSS